MTSSRVLCIPAPVAQELRSIALCDRLDGGRFERCGILVGRRRTRTTFVEAMIELPNRATGDRTTSFRIDPLELLDVLVPRARPPHDLVGVWHTHPKGGTDLSPTDLRELPPGLSLLVLARCSRPDRPDEVSFRSFRIHHAATLTTRRSDAGSPSACISTAARRPCPVP